MEIILAVCIFVAGGGLVSLYKWMDL